MIIVFCMRFGYKNDKFIFILSVKNAIIYVKFGYTAVLFVSSSVLFAWIQIYPGLLYRGFSSARKKPEAAFRTTAVNF